MDSNNKPASAAILPDDSLVIGGVQGIWGTPLEYGNWGSTVMPFVMKLDDSGSLDSSFGTSGVTTVSYTGWDNTQEDLAVQPDGKILLSGNAMGACRASDRHVYKMIVSPICVLSDRICIAARCLLM